ncbi:MAG: TolC family protein [Pseudomonadota bacterium]|nr:TolC family protein [Pseudomonadota bacterium]
MLLALFVPYAFALTLDEAWQRAESDGDDAALIERQMGASTTIRGQAAAALLPKVSLSAGYTINQTESTIDFSKMIPEELADFVGESEPIVVNKKEFWSGSFTVVQPLFSGSALPAWTSAQAMARAAEAQADAQLDQLRVGVARAYWGAYVGRERVRLTTDGVARAEKYLALAETRERVGAGRSIDTAQAGVALARARRELVQADASRVEAEQGLARLLDVEPGVALERPAPRAIAVASPEAAADLALDAPAVTAAEERAKAARAARTATDLGWVPTVNGRFTESYSQNSGFSGEEWNWQAAITADWMLFDGGYRIAKEREAAMNKEVARLAAERERDQASADARSLWAAHGAAKEARAQATIERDLAERALKLAEASYELGALTFLDLWQTRQQRDGAELAELAADMQLDLAAIALVAKTGGW